MTDLDELITAFARTSIQNPDLNLTEPNQSDLPSISNNNQSNLPSISENNNMTTLNITVRDYLELIPQFDGEPSQVPIFIEACEQVLSMVIPDPTAATAISRLQFLMLHFRTKIVGKAAAVISARQYSTFPELKRLIIETFGDQRNEESLLNDLFMLAQKSNETAVQFADRCIQIRSLLMAKLQCAEISQALRIEKTTLYNKIALRSFLSGLNSSLSHLLRCKSPISLEEAVNMLIEEENMNYNRSQKIGFRNSSNPPHKNQNVMKTQPHNLRVNPHVARQNFLPMNPQWRPLVSPTQNLSPRPAFQRPQNNFRNQPFTNQASSSRFPTPHRPPWPVKPSTVTRQYPEPMDTTSGNTRLQSMRTQRKSPWTQEELHMQEEEESPPCNALEYYPQEDQVQDETQYESQYEYEYYPEEQANPEENFRIPASENQN